MTYMKLVINNCYGGFSLSPKGLKRYLELKGKEAYFYVQTSYKFQNNVDAFERIDNIESINTPFVYCTTYDQGKTISDYPEDTFYGREIERNDPILVQVVEELGREASSSYSYLVVKEIENGRWYKITEYDGFESIEYRDIDDEWMLAEE